MACGEIHVAFQNPSLYANRERLEIAVARMHVLASIHRMLQPSRTDLVDLGNILCELCHYSAEARVADQGPFIQLRTGEFQVDANRGLVLLTIVSELLANSARHAFCARGGLVLIDVTRTDDVAFCRISDNGVGIGADSGKRRTGTDVIAELARRAEIALTVASGDSGSRFAVRGSRFELRIPCAADDTMTIPMPD